MKRRIMTQLCMLAVLFGLSAHAQSIIPQKDEKKGLWGYVSKSDGKWVVKPKFDEATELTASPNGQLRGTVTQKGKKGFIDDSGKILGAGVVFEEITPMQGDAMFVKVKGKTGVADYSGVYKVKPEIIDITELPGEGYIANLKGKKGFLNYDGSWMLDPIYKEIDVSLDGFILIDKGGKAGIFDRKGNSLLAASEYTKVEPFGSLWKVYKGKKVGLYDLSKCKLLVKPEYVDVNQPLVASNGNVLYPVSDKLDKWGVLNADGKDVVKKKYSKIQNLDGINALLLYEGPIAKRLYFIGDKKACKVKSHKRNPIKNGFYGVDLVYDKNWENHPLSLIELPNGSVEFGLPSDVSLINQFVYYDGNLYDSTGSVIMSDIIASPGDISGWTLVGDRIISPDSKIYNCKNINGIVLVEDNPDDYRLITKYGKLSFFNVDNAEIFGYNCIAVESDGKWGLYSKDKDRIILPMVYKTLPEIVTLSNRKVFYKVVDMNGCVGLFHPTKDSWIISPESGFSNLEINKLNHNDDDKNKNSEYLIVTNDKGQNGLFNSSSMSWVIPLETGCSDIKYMSYYNIENKEVGFFKVINNEGNAGIMNASDESWLISPENGYKDIELVNRGKIRHSGLLYLPKSTFVLTKNGKKGVYYDSKEIIAPTYDDIEFSGNMDGDFFATFTKNGKKHLYKNDFDHEIQQGVHVAEFTYSRSFNTACNLSLRPIYLPNEEKVIISVKIYNKNGTPARTKGGYTFEFTDEVKLSDGYGGYGDIIAFDINEFDVGKFEKKSFYMLLTVKNPKGKQMPIIGDKRIDFYLQGKYY